MSESLSEEAYGVALTGLESMSPRRLYLVLRSGIELREVWDAMAGGRAGGPAVLDRLVHETPALRARWVDETRRTDVAERWSRCCDQSVLLLGRAGYPEALAGDLLPPGVLFARGNPAAADGRAVAIVGTRHATVGGMEVAATLGHDLAAAGITVVSGLAKGIDGAVHRGALAADGGAPPWQWWAAVWTWSTRHATGVCGLRWRSEACSAARRRRGARPPPIASRPATGSWLRWPSWWSSWSRASRVALC